MKRTLLTFFLILFSVPVAAQLSFTDATNEAGVANSLGSQQRLATNLAWGDYDGDGDLDLYVTNWGAAVNPNYSINRLYRNNGSGSFSDVGQSVGVADNRNSLSGIWGDYDNDGDLDLYVVNVTEQDQLYRNDGGTFSRVTGSAGINVISQGNEIAAAWGDYDNDGDLDLYLCKYYFQNSFYRNNGDGTFSEVAASSGIADVRDSEDAAWGDYDDDGDLDLYVVNREQNNALYQNDGNGSFTEVACALTLDDTDVGRSARWIDFDNDGDLDLSLSNIGANALYRNDGNDQFVNVATGDLRSLSNSWISWASAWGDFDADGLLDLLVANGGESRSGQVSPVLRSVNVGSFSDVTASSGLSTDGSSATSAGRGDADGDGDLDLYLVNGRFNVEANVLYRNETSAVNTITVRARRKGAADGIGARISLVQANQVVGHRQIASGPDAMEAVFGVQDGQTYTVEVTFADGSTASQGNLTAGAVVEIEQP